MIRLRTFIVMGWLFLLMVFLTEQAIFPGIAPEMYPSPYASAPLCQYEAADHFFDFLIQPFSHPQTLPAPAIKEPRFKWKSFLPERFIQPFKSVGGFPELVQDDRHCRSVSIVLFPYHEFL